jgi:hypothetical protein
MGAGFKVETRYFWNGSNCIVVCNYDAYNLVVNWPMKMPYKLTEFTNDIGMWRVKQLKK